MCEADFRIVLFELNVCIYKLNIFLGFKHVETITKFESIWQICKIFLCHLNECDSYVKILKVFSVSCPNNT